MNMERRRRGVFRRFSAQSVAGAVLFRWLRRNCGRAAGCVRARSFPAVTEGEPAMQGKTITQSVNVRRSAALLGAALLGVAALAAAPRVSAQQADLDCKMSFSVSGWSAIYKRADGHGVVTCENGETMPVHIRVRGGGLTAGKWRIDNGTGNFTDVHR